MRLATQPREDWTPFGYKCSINVCRMRIESTVIELHPKLGMLWEFCSRDMPPGTTGAFLVDPRFQGFAECSGPLQAFSTHIIGVISYSLKCCWSSWCVISSFQGGRMGAVLGKRAEWTLGRRCEAVAHRTGRCLRREKGTGIPLEYKGWDFSLVCSKKAGKGLLVP